MTDLDKLIEAVEAGEYSDGMFCPLFHRSGHCVNMEAAYLASLDAAKALHDALLPDWAWSIECENSADVWPRFRLESAIRAYADDGTPARAWLLAILKACRSQQDASP